MCNWILSVLDGVGEEMLQCDGKLRGQPTGQCCLLGGFYATELNLNTLMKTRQWQGKRALAVFFFLYVQERKRY